MHYHVWFITKYRRRVLVGDAETLFKRVFDDCVERNGYDVLEYECGYDHVHILVRASDRKSLSRVVQKVKCVTSAALRSENPACRELGEHFWGKRYGFKIVPRQGINMVRQYIRNQKEKHA